MKLRFTLSIHAVLLATIATAQTGLLEWPISNYAIARFHVNGFPDFLATDESGVWVTNEGRVEKMVFGQVGPVLTVMFPNPCGAMAVGFGSLWVASCREQSVYRINTKTGSIEANIHTGLADHEGELSIAVGAGSVWIMSNSKGELARIDPKKNVVSSRIVVAPNSYAVIFGFKSIWLTNTQTNSIQRVNPQTEKITSIIKTGSNPRFLAAGAGAVWTLNQGDGTVSRIDPTTEKVTSIDAQLQGSGGDIAASDAFVYVRAKKALLTVIDPTTNQMVVHFGPPAGSGSVRVENGRVWVTAHDINTIWVMDESKVKWRK